MTRHGVRLEDDRDGDLYDRVILRSNLFCVGFRDPGTSPYVDINSYMFEPVLKF